MCTASNYITDDHYFGRNFDYEISYNERVTITPRNYELKFRKIDDIKTHYAIIGMAVTIEEYPLSICKNPFLKLCDDSLAAMCGANNLPPG